MSMLHRVNVTIVNVKNRREVMLERPPFCLDGEVWREAVNQTRKRVKAGAKGEPFLIATQFYAQLGGRVA